MRNWTLVLLLVIAVPIFLIPTTGCHILFPDLFPAPDAGDNNGDNSGDNNGDNNGGDNNDDGDDDDDDNEAEDTFGFTIVKTNIAVQHDAGLRVGDDLIAFGTGAVTGVSYIVPSTNPTAGTPVPDTGNYRSKGFAVGGRTIFLVNNNFEVAVFNVDAGGPPTVFAQNDIRLASIPAGANDVGHIQADGDYCIVRCDATTVTDGRVLKVIDVTGDTPAVISLNNPPDVTSGFAVQQVAVDATTKRAFAAAGSPAALYVYDLTTPAADPTAIALPEGISGVQMQVSGDYLIALDDRSYPQAFLVDLEANEVVAPTGAEGIADVAIGDTTFAFFANADANDSSGGDQRAAVGAVTEPSFAKAALDQYIDGSTTNNGLRGFAGSLCVTPNGNHVFLADSYLQYSPGTTAFVIPDDPAGTDPWACPAWDVHCGANTVGFKTAPTAGSGTDRTIGYIRLTD